MDPLEWKNKHGVTVREGITVWRTGEADLTNPHHELSAFPPDTIVADVWDKLSDHAKDAVALGWIADYE